MVVIARDEDEPYVAGDEGIGNRRDRPALEISVEDRKIEVGFPRRFQRLVDARGDADHHVVFDDEELGLLRGLRFGCHPSLLAWNRDVPRSEISPTMHCGRLRATVKV